MSSWSSGKKGFPSKVGRLDGDPESKMPFSECPQNFELRSSVQGHLWSKMFRGVAIPMPAGCLLMDCSIFIVFFWLKFTHAFILG